MRAMRRVTNTLDSPVAMIITVVLTAFWLYHNPESWYDGLLAGGAMLLAQAIYKNGEPRDIAMHKKLDEIIHALDKADDNIAGSEEEIDKSSDQ